jgi:hypothetical protein
MTAVAPLDDRFADLAIELGVVAARLGDLIDVVSGNAVAVPQRVVIDAVRNPWDWRGEGGTYHAVKIDNPTAAVVVVSFASGNGARLAAADELVPAHTGRVITRPFDTLSIGFDPATIPAGISTLFVTIYARQLNPASYPFV